MVPFINRLSLLLLPITSTVTSLSENVLKVAGVKSKEETNVRYSCQIIVIVVISPIIIPILFLYLGNRRHVKVSSKRS
jgi:hypothetical protein